MAEDQLQVIIAGAGIAGLTVAISLRNHPGINVEVYEQAAELQEIGASIALGPNGLRTLERLGVDNALDDGIAFRGPSGIPMIYRHWKTNEIVSMDNYCNVPERRYQTARFHRAYLQQALLEKLPKNIIHLNKKVADVKADEEVGVTVLFADNTSVTGDILLGADGIHSKVRNAFVPEYQLKWTGRVVFRSIFDASLTDDIPDLPSDSTHWWGSTNTFFASPLGKNKFTIVGDYNTDPDSPNARYKHTSWNDEGDIADLRNIYKGWHPVVKALCAVTPSTKLFPNVAGAPLKTWVFNSRVTLLGDAAHAHGGAFAAGGSLAIDDAYALCSSLLHVFPSTQSQKPTAAAIQRALTLYEKTRRPHTDRVLNIVHRMLLHPKRDHESDEELRKRMRNRVDTVWIHEHDVRAAFMELLKLEKEDRRQGEFASHHKVGVDHANL
ncbi:MAG: hypothetical protein M1834_002597 [Cirrosporium novae-zelandiae]|nr:MAG: hypothetical protein M1834_002597 [Cirrosporium novae-zelandiae]